MQYIALTIGPIYRTLGRARKTRELWGASYLFSRVIMQRIVKELKSNGVGSAIILPQIAASSAPSKVGLYPDRLYMEGDHRQVLERAIENVKEELVSEFSKAECASHAQEFVDRYFYFNVVVADVDSKGQLLDTLFKYVAQTELHQRVLPVDNLCIEKLLLRVYDTDFFEKCFGKGHRYPSLIEIATRKMVSEGVSRGKFKELERAGKAKKKNPQSDGDEDEDAIIIGIAHDGQLKAHFKQPHKYIAVVQSDGDNVGTLLGQILASDDPDLVSAFSGALGEFARTAVEAIENYGGEAVYAGGDDLLFFAPVLTHEGDIFRLLDRIDAIFREKVMAHPQLTGIIDQLDKTPSMSYGVAITYYKFPLNEARDRAYEMLGQAKEEGKNRIGYHWQKHSGQHFTDVIEKRFCSQEEQNGMCVSDFYCLFLDLLKTVHARDAERLFSSFIHNLSLHKPILGPILADTDEKKKQEKLGHYFENFYDEPLHKTAQAQAVMQDIKCLLLAAYRQASSHGDKADAAIEDVYNALRFVKFLTQKARDDD